MDYRLEERGGDDVDDKGAEVFDELLRRLEGRKEHTKRR